MHAMHQSILVSEKKNENSGSLPLTTKLDMFKINICYRYICNIYLHLYIDVCYQALQINT